MLYRTIRGELGGAPVDRWGDFGGTDPASSSAPSRWMHTHAGGETMLIAEPIPAIGSEASPISALVRVGDGHFYCSGEGTTARRSEGRIELTLQALRDLGTCEDAAPIAGSISGCGSEPGFCTIESTIDALPFRSDALGGLFTGGGYRLLSFDLADEMKLWVWQEGGAVVTGLLYDATTQHVYCVGTASLESDRRWSLGELRDLGTCDEAPAIEGSLQSCTMR